MAMDHDEREERFREQRLEMVYTQIERRGVKDPAILEAMRRVPRHRFMTESHWAEAYSDHPLPIGHDQTISQPYIVAYMTELLRVGVGDKVLEVGAGSGYQAAVLAEMGCEVYSVEIVPELADRARAKMEELDYANVHVMCGDGYRGWLDEAPFDGIIVTAAPVRMPRRLTEQLQVGARMVVPVGDANQDLFVIERTEQGLDERITIPVRFVPMTGKSG